MYIEDYVEILAKDDSKENYKFLFDHFKHRVESDSKLSELAPDYIVIGGDGSLSYFLNQVFKNNPSKNKVLYIPDGTANDFARSLNLSIDLLENLDSDKMADFIYSQKKIDCPVMKCNDLFFINVVTMGAPARVTESGNNKFKEMLGQFSYYLSALEEIFEKHELEMKLSFGGPDRKTMNFNGLGVIVGQGLYAGGGVKVTDSIGAMFGKHFYCTISTDQNISSSLKSLLKMQSEKLNEEDNIKSCLFEEELKLSFDQKIPIKVDGEPFEYEEILFGKSKHHIQFLTY